MDKVRTLIAADAWQSLGRSFASDLASRNWSVYGQWLGFGSFVLDIILGIVNLLHLSLIVIFAIICIVEGVFILFLEVPLLLRVCPLTARFVDFVRRFQENLPRAGLYLVLAGIQYGSLGISVTSLLACAIVMTAAAICFALAHITKQEFIASAALGGEEASEREMLP